MIFHIILTIILFIVLITGIYTIYNAIVGIRLKDSILNVIGGIYIVIIIIILGLVLSSFLFNI